MKPTNILNLVILLIAVACTSNLSPQDKTSQAKLINDLAIEGCLWHLTVDLDGEKAEFVPDDASQSKLDPIINAVSSQVSIYSVDVEITYRLTGNKKSVKCGRKRTDQFDEIELVDIKLIK